MASHDEIVMRDEGISGALKAINECIREGLKSRPEKKRGWTYEQMDAERTEQ